MKNILYIGNNLSKPTANISAIAILEPLLTDEGFTVHTASAKASQFWRLFDMLLAVLKHYKHLHGVLIDTYSTKNFYYAFFVAGLCQLLGLKYIPILHGGNLPKRLKKSPIKSHLLFKPAYKLVAPSEYIKAAFEAHGYQNIRYIPNALDIKDYQFQKKQFKTINLLWVRSFSTIYNPSLAVQVLKTLQETGYNCSLCMVGPDTGDGSFQATKQLAIDLAVPVKFTGKLTKPEWLALAADFNVFINTTNFDNMPVSVMEAMALGLPVVSTNVGGMPYLIAHEKTGYLVPANNATAFKTAILKIVSDPEAANLLAQNARNKIETFAWQTVKQHWKDLLNAL